MNELLRRLIEAYTAGDGDQAARAAAVRAELAEAAEAAEEPLDLEELVNAAIDEFSRINGEGNTDLSDQDLVTLEALAEVTAAVREVQTEAEQAAAERRQRADDLAARVRGEDGSDGETDDGSDGEGTGTEGDGAEGTEGDGEGAGTEGTDEGAGTEGREPVGAGATASRQTAPRLPLNKVRPRTAGRRPADPRRSGASTGGTGWEIRAAADIPDIPSGARLAGLTDLASAADQKLYHMARTTSGGRVSASLATFRRDLPAQFVARTEDDYGVIARATDERQLSGGSLVAAGGWCAPSTIDYGMGVDPAATDGMVDLPTVQMPRGGLRYPIPPDFAAVYSNTGYFHQTEAQAIAGTAKPCWEITCPTMDEVRLDVDGLCITAPILTDRAWPENTAYLIAQTMAAHAHKLNAWKIAAMVAKAGAAVVVPAPGAGAYHLGAVPTLLGYLELQVEYVRYRNRLAEGTTLELVVPRWLRGLLRSDLTKMVSDDPNTLTVTNEQLDAWLRSRGVRPQYVVDWQDAFATGNVADFGGTTNPLVWPATVDLLIYQAGAYFAGGEELIRLDGLYDSTNIRTNTFTALFTEESVGVGLRGTKPYLLRIPLKATGVRAGMVTDAVLVG